MSTSLKKPERYESAPHHHAKRDHRHRRLLWFNELKIGIRNIFKNKVDAFDQLYTMNTHGN